MRIRSVTLFCQPDIAPTAAPFLAAARNAFPVPVQTVRVATPPFPDWWDDHTNPQAFVAGWQTAGADYISLGPVLLRHDTAWLERLLSLLGAGDALFASVEIADGRGRIDPQRCHQLAGIIQRASTLQASGFGNLYLTAVANCPPGSPFFPVAYHGDGKPGFAIALEAADIVLRAVQAAATLAEARGNIVAAIEREAAGLVAAARQLAAAHGIPFQGIDFSPAPFPDADKSLAGAMEALGLPAVGAPGSLFAAAFITEAIGRADFPRCGFSGLMLPVLEDSVLAARAAAGEVTVSDLLSYAAVCGVGLDTIPLPGDISQGTLAGILLDVAALASRLNKPLTARLMPLPGLAAGDPVHFDFPFFADSRIMPVIDAGLSHLLTGAGAVDIERFGASE